MTRVLVLNGPNLGTLGTRETEIYGNDTLASIEDRVRERAQSLGVDVRWEQTNHEGALVDLLEEERGSAAGCVINPGGLSHTSVALADAIRAFGKPVVEVHISNIHSREPYRRVSLSAEAATAVVAGLGPHGYVLALEGLLEMIARGSTKERSA
jgi:3-dehydroquinate dehydratase-2